MWTDKSIDNNIKDTDMQQGEMFDLAKKTRSKIRDYFKDRANGFIIKNIYDNEREKMFSVCFRAYHYFSAVVRCDGEGGAVSLIMVHPLFCWTAHRNPHIIRILPTYSLNC